MKNNESTIVNLADSNERGTHWIAMKFINNKLFYFDSYGIEFIPDISKKEYDKIIKNIYRIQSINSNECGKFCIMFILNQHAMFVNLKNQNLFQKNKLKDSYQIYSVKYPF